MFRLIDKKFRVPRVWSNIELRKFAHFFESSVVNVSGWKDLDKQGTSYEEYFVNAKKYYITNFKHEMRGFQGDREHEFYLDLELPLPPGFPQFDVVFNHTVLEHVFEIGTAFANLCELTKDVVIVVVPFMQEQHADYGDYWRFTPLAIDRLFKKNGLDLVYVNANNQKDSSIYVFAIASRFPERWKKIKAHPDNMLEILGTEAGMIGTNVINNSVVYKIFSDFKRFLKKRLYTVSTRS